MAMQSYDTLLSDIGNTASSTADMLNLDENEMNRDVELLKTRLVNMDKGLLKPGGTMMTYWDFFTLGALFFTATITPYEVCLMWKEVMFKDGVSEWLTPLFVLNIFVNCIFIVDICFNFFLPYTESIKKGGGQVKSHRLIARNYMRGWFPLDFVSVIPVDLVLMTIDTSQLDAAALFRFIKMLRLLRLIKLARILRASRIFSRWENRISISYGNQSLIKLFIGVLLMLHWLSCLLGLMAQLMTPFRPPDMRASVELAQTNDPTCVGCTDALNTVRGSVCFSVCLTECEIMSEVNNTGSLEAFVRSSEAWVCRYASSGKIQAMPAYHGEVWIAGLYVAMIQLGGGVGSIVPENLIEYIVYWLCIFLGSLAWAGVVGTICAVLTTSDPSTLEFKVDMDSLNYFMEDMNMPNGLRLRVREYLRNKRDLYKKRSYNDLLDILSPELKTEVVHKMSGDLLSQVWYLHELEKENERPCLVELSTSLQRAVFAPREKVPAIGLNILMRGVAAKSGNILTPITTWGEDVIVTSQALRDSRTASALTFVEIAYLTRDVIYGVVSKYPMSHAIIKNAAMKIAISARLSSSPSS